MKFLRVPPEKLAKWQHYHDVRDRLWIKLYTSLLDPESDVDYSLLPDASKCLLHHVWLLAARTDNRIPYNKEWISKRRLNVRSAINLKELLAKGFLEIFEESLEGFLVPPLDDSLVPHASLSLKSSPLGALEGESEGKPVAADFEAVWREYPRKKGRDKALAHFKAQIKTRSDLAAITSAVRNYRREIEALGTEERFVQHGSTFFHGTWRDYADGVWKAPKTERGAAPKSKPPSDEVRRLMETVK